MSLSSLWIPKRRLERALFSSFKSALSQSVLLDIHRYNAELEFTKTALAVRHVLLERATCVFLSMDSKSKIDKRCECLPPADIEYRKGPPHCRHRSYHFGKSRYKSNVLRLCLPSSILFFQERDFQNPGKVLSWRGLQTPVFYRKFDVQKTCALIYTPIKTSSAEPGSIFLKQTSSAIFPKFERTA